MRVVLSLETCCWRDESKPSAMTSRAGISRRGRKSSIPLERQESPLHKSHLSQRRRLEKSGAWFCSHLHFWEARGTSPKSLESQVKTIRRTPLHLLLHYFCLCYKSRKQNLKKCEKNTRATSEVGKCHFSCPALDFRFHKSQALSTAVVKIKLHTKSKPMTLYVNGHNKMGSKF